MSWKKHPAAGIFLIAGGIAMLMGAIWLSIDTVRFTASADRTPGTVVALQRERGARGSKRDHPVVAYQDSKTGSTVQFKSSFGIWPSPFKPGDAVVVAVRATPRRVEIASFWTLWFMQVVLVACALACLLAGRSVLLTHRDSGS